MTIAKSGDLAVTLVTPVTMPVGEGEQMRPADCHLPLGRGSA
jgi:hypothetical protein